MDTTKIITNTQIIERINEYVHSKRYRELLRMRLVDGLTYEQIAEAAEMSTAQVYRIVKKYADLIKNDE